jgi:cation diffusion facilitator CzcD-associated flavoprotein CzcO
VPKGPNGIDGIEAFKGKVFHSSKWNHEVDLHDKDVLVMGNGASANQFVPWLLGNTDISSLTQVVRSGQWIAPKENETISNIRKWYASLFTSAGPITDVVGFSAIFPWQINCISGG